ncbi:hypothetical protein JMN32_14875 [Fulvivirga sp. 29W222]|uniref:Uncharacterized protein n=1 Tax=Fulvivirga marina TaxID=2494733 RepID=A0A937FX00_9BACT|nr:hypothetical protein [Fulvivirga marina]MBL6447599.1 hypothetical protein [Fulvivirga marina]
MRYPKNHIASVLLVVVLVSTLKTSFIYLDFQLNKDFIAKFLCEKRDEPITVCGGKCYLGKQLKKAQDTENDQKTPTSAKVRFENLYTVVDFQFSPLAQSTLLSQTFTPYQTIHSSGHLAQIFHPPRLV